MKTVELYARVRRALLVEGMSQRTAAREFGLAHKTVRKMLEYSAPPGYQRQKPVRRPKLGPWQGAIDAILEDDKQHPRKQRHTDKRIFERLRAEHSYSGGCTIMKDYVRSSKIGGQEMFVPLVHAPGEAQADFGQAQVVIAGVESTAHFMVFALPHSDDCNRASWLGSGPLPQPSFNRRSIVLSSIECLGNAIAGVSPKNITTTLALKPIRLPAQDETLLFQNRLFEGNKVCSFIRAISLILRRNNLVSKNIVRSWQ